MLAAAQMHKEGRLVQPNVKIPDFVGGGTPLQAAKPGYAEDEVQPPTPEAVKGRAEEPNDPDNPQIRDLQNKFYNRITGTPASTGI
jgi:hypothetical protein